MRRLYLQIYLAFVAVLVLFGALMALTWWLVPGEGPEHTAEGMSALVGAALPPKDQPPVALQTEVDRLAREFNADITVRGEGGGLLAQAGDVLPMPPAQRTGSGWIRAPGGPPMLALHLADERWVMARWRHRRHGFGLLGALLLLAAAVALGAYPIARRITGRLERLQARVDALGAGDLQARVQVEGCDEVGELARSFNRAADRIEQLVNAQKHVLAGASHELRSPLTRMRIAIELLPGAERPELRAQLFKDIAELDGLIDELLLASRLDALDRPARAEDVDVLALLAEEAARTGAQVTGEAVVMHGDARLLRRLMRNLLENAQRYAGSSAVEGEVRRLEDGTVEVRVCDRGPGIAQEERSRIFQPFYRPAGTAEGNGGVGLGLALVREIARHHGGDVSYMPREGGGSCFAVQLRSGSAKSN
jgi:signal transduction histidine kinase